MSRYQSTSLYLYPGTNTLKNNWGIKDEKKLKVYEIGYVGARINQLLESPYKGNFDFDHLKAIHKYIFQDAYPFAGQIRSENIQKGSTRFAQVMHIESSAATLFLELEDEKENLKTLNKKEFADRTAYYMAELNVLHPFREGNGRTTREFIRAFCLNYGYDLAFNKVDKDIVLQASIRSTLDYKPLANIIEQCLDKSKILEKKKDDYER